MPDKRKGAGKSVGSLQVQRHTCVAVCCMTWQHLKELDGLGALGVCDQSDDKRHNVSILIALVWRLLSGKAPEQYVCRKDIHILYMMFVPKYEDARGSRECHLAEP